MQELFFAQKAFIVRAGRVLLVQKSAADPDQPLRWEVPGGRMRFGEDVDEHLIREVKEEVGLDVAPGRPFYIWQWRLARRGVDGSERDMQVVAVARLCEARLGELSADGRDAEDFLSEARWVPVADVVSYDLIPNMVPVVAAFLEAMRK